MVWEIKHIEKTIAMNDFMNFFRSIGNNGEPEFEGKRVVQLFMYARMFEEDNHYAHPLDFVVGEF